MKGLHHVESNLFFPWLKMQLVNRIQDPTSRDAFQRIIKTMMDYQEQLIRQGQFVMDALENTDDSDDDDNSDISLDALTPVVTTMVSTLIQQSRLQTQFLVPVITLLIPACEQTSLNSIILRSMGVWDSRLYLVGMSEAVEELSSSPTLEEGDITERDLFRQEIPMLIRSLIPRWKRLLYDPRIMIPTPSSSCHAMADRSNE